MYRSPYGRPVAVALPSEAYSSVTRRVIGAVDPQVEAAIEEERLVIAAVQADQFLPPLSPPRVAGHRDDELEDSVVGQEIEEMAAAGQPAEPFLDHPEKRLQRPEALRVAGSHQSGILSGDRAETFMQVTHLALPADAVTLRPTSPTPRRPAVRAVH